MNLIFLLSLITLSSADDDIFGFELSSGSEDSGSGSGSGIVINNNKDPQDYTYVLIIVIVLLFIGLIAGIACKSINTNSNVPIYRTRNLKRDNMPLERNNTPIERDNKLYTFTNSMSQSSTV